MDRIRQKNHIVIKDIRNLVHVIFFIVVVIFFLNKVYHLMIPYLMWLTMDYIMFRHEKLNIKRSADYYGSVQNTKDQQYKEEEIKSNLLSTHEDVPSQHFYWLKYRILNQFLRPGGKILDVACGRGIGAGLLRKDCRIFGCDFVNYTDEFEKNTTGSFVVGDAGRLPFPDESFNYVVSIESIEHFPNVDKVAVEMARVLKAKGKLFIVQPNGLLTFGLGSQSTLSPINLIESILISKGKIKPVRSKYERHHGVYIYHFYRNLGEISDLMDAVSLKAIYMKTFFSSISRILFKLTKQRELCEKVDAICSSIPILNSVGSYLLVVGQK